MALAGLHNRLAWALADVLPPREIEQHHRTAIELFERLADTNPQARLAGELPYDDPRDGVAHSQLHLANVLRDTDEVDALRLAAWQHFQQQVASKPRSQWHRAAGRNHAVPARRECPPRRGDAGGTAQRISQRPPAQVSLGLCLRTTGRDCCDATRLNSRKPSSICGGPCSCSRS